MDLQNNKFCCEKMAKVLKEKERPLLNRESLYNWISFAARRISYCPFCGVMYIEKKLIEDSSVEFCCRLIECSVEICDQSDEFDLYYQPWTRRYFFSKCKYWKEGEVYKEWDIQYCIFCGTKLPESLYKEWVDLVQEKFCFTPDLSEEDAIEATLAKLPEELRTDLWWKRLGL